MEAAASIQMGGDGCEKWEWQEGGSARSFRMGRTLNGVLAQQGHEREGRRHTIPGECCSLLSASPALALRLSMLCTLVLLSAP